jgi:hypothetical protein
MTLRSRATAATNGITHEFASPAPPPPLLVPSLSSSSSSSSIITEVLPSNNITGEKRPITSPIHHSLAPVHKKLKRSGTITIDD